VKLLPSLRGRVILGATLWTIGLFGVSVILSSFSPVIMAHIRGLHTRSITAALVAAGGLAAGFALVRGGLLPIVGLRSRLADVRRGAAQRMTGRYPLEVQPLVDDLNALLDHRDETVRRAVAKAGDLAHGLKTPLAILAQEADRAAAAGDRDRAAAIRQQVDRMQRQIDYHLAQARAAAAGRASGAHTAVAESVDALARTLQQLHAERGIAIHAQLPQDAIAAVQREDLDEMLGNLLDNGCKWARSQVRVSSRAIDGRLAVDVEDDGPGIEPSKREVVLQRGVRADEAAPGSGLGLAIVRDLAELYGGAIVLGASPLGGVCATLRLPIG